MLTLFSIDSIEWFDCPKELMKQTVMCTFSIGPIALLHPGIIQS